MSKKEIGNDVEIFAERQILKDRCDAEFERAAGLTRNAQEKALLLARACG